MVQYDSYKSSGEIWLGEIPAGWDVRPLKHIFEIQKRIAGQQGYTVLSITRSGIRPKDMSSQGQFAEDYSNYQLVYPGDFAMNHMDLLTGWVDISKYEGVTSPDYRVFTNKNAADYLSDYFKYILQYCYSNKVFYGLGQGVAGFGRWRLPAEMFLNFKLPVPTKLEQAAIIEYLNDKVSRIDSIVAEAKASIEEYKAWRASIIYKAVTKGLDTSVGMIANGSKWIPETPAGTKVSRVGLHYDIVLGKMLCPDQIDKTYTLEPYFCAANVHFSGVETGNLKEMWFNPKEKELYKVEPGDLLVVEGGAGAGGSAIVQECDRDTYVQNSIMIVRGRRGNSNGFLKYVLESLVGRGYVDFACNKATIPHFTKEKLGNTPYPVFAPDEQIRITTYLDEQCGSINALIGEKEALISDLEAYKKSLIFEVVTGKRRVC